MLRLIRTHLTYANVMSSIAVFVALGSGSAYAFNEWNGDNIQDGSLTSADIQGSFADLQNPYVEGTITTEDIRNGTLFPVDLADNSIGGGKIADNSLGSVDVAGLTGEDITPDAIGGGHVANDSLDGFDVQNLTGLDLIDGSVGGPDLADGSVGAEDLAPGVRGFTRFTQRSVNRRLDRGDRLSLVVNCPSGWSAISGGIGHSAERNPDDFATSSFGRFNARAWQVVGRHVGGAGADRLTVHLSVLCVQ